MMLALQRLKTLLSAGTSGVSGARGFSSGAAAGFNGQAGLFGIPELASPSAWDRYARDTIAESNSLVHEIKIRPPSHETIHLMDDLSDTLCRALDPAQLCAACHVDPTWRHEAQRVLVGLGDYVHSLNTDPALYRAVEAAVRRYRQAPPASRLSDPSLRLYSPECVRVGEMLLRDCERSGVHLEEGPREQVARLTNEIRSAEMHYLQTLSDPAAHGYADLHANSQALAALPHGLQGIKGGQGGPFRSVRRALGAGSSSGHRRIPLDTQTFWGFMYNVSDRDMRRQVYLQGMQQPEANLGHLMRIVTGRQELSKLIGYPSYAAHQAAYGTLAAGPRAATAFVSDIAASSQGATNAERETLEWMQRKTGHPLPLRWWDVPYLMGKAGEGPRGPRSDAALSDYLHIESCIGGLIHLADGVFGLKVAREEPEWGEGWAPEVVRLAVSDNAGPVGTVYLDLKHRPHKHSNAATFMIRCGRAVRRATATATPAPLESGAAPAPREPRVYQLPVVALACNFSSDTLSQTEFETLLHEFGHVLHALLSRTDFQHVSGTRGPPDFTEVPSHLVEKFAGDPSFLRSFARHRVTAEPLSLELAKRAADAAGSRRQFGAFALRDQVLHSLVDLEVFGQDAPMSPKALQYAVSSLYAQYMPLPLEPGSQPHLRFHHFVGYGGQYYSYLFARCIAEALWAKFFLNGPDRAGGEAVRELLLRPGGAVAPQALVRQLLGKGALREVEDGFAPSGELVAGFLRGALGEEALGGGGRPADGVVG